MAAPDFHVFCRVVDNYGDAGVCWRLARELVAEHGVGVAFFIDDRATLARIEPRVDVHADAQVVAGVVVRRIDDAARHALPAVVVEGFGCGLPGDYVAAMAAAVAKPLWINLEYLSAEPWVDAAHALASPHPQLPLVRHFWFPGFTARTGGLLRERDLFARRDAWRARHPRHDDALRVLLFTYDNAALPALFAHWSTGTERICCEVPEGVAVASLEAWLDAPVPAPGGRLVRGRVEIAVVPFTDLDGFDRRLFGADVSFVRGEDSFVRAQWAARPFVWQPYRQRERAHVAKLDAFLARYVADLGDDARSAVASLWHAFVAEDAGAIGGAWDAFRAARAPLALHASTWAMRLVAEVPELAASLVAWSRERL